MTPITAEQLEDLVVQLELADDDARDALLHNLLQCPWPTKVTQDN